MLGAGLPRLSRSPLPGHPRGLLLQFGGLTPPRRTGRSCLLPVSLLASWPRSVWGGDAGFSGVEEPWQGWLTRSSQFTYELGPMSLCLLVEAWALSRTVLCDAQSSKNVGPSSQCAPNLSADFFFVNFVCATIAYLLTGDEHSSLSPQVLGR